MSELQYTPVDSIAKKVEALRSFYRSGYFDSVANRIDVLRKLYFAIKDNEDEIKFALHKDLNKPINEIEVSELSVIYSDLLNIIKNLEKWSKPHRVPFSELPLPFYFSSTKVKRASLGVVLIIAPFNFPVSLSLQPLFGAIAGGNTVVLKPSELTPYSAEVLTEIITSSIDPNIISVVNGGIPETTELLNIQFDKILYTGNGTVGKIVAKSAAQFLTPTILELGGKSPAIITKNLSLSQLEIAVKRILFTKFSNAGQICVATDYILCHSSQFKPLVGLLKKQLKLFYPDITSSNFPHIIHKNSFKRLTNIIASSRAAEVYHLDDNFDANDIDNLYIPPHLLVDVGFDDSSMTDEIFGPILPIVKYDVLEDALLKVQTHHDTPLALYGYTTDKKEQNLIESRIRSGAVLFNDGMVHVGVSDLPFGGVGQSGYGKYHGKYSFQAFTHERVYMNQPYWIEPVFNSKYPPMSNFDLKLLKWFLTPRVWFGRSGKVNSKFSSYLEVLFIAVAGFLIGYFYPQKK